MEKKKGLKTYTIHFTRDSVSTAEIKATSFEEAYERAVGMTTEELVDAPGEVLDERHVLTGLFE